MVKTFVKLMLKQIKYVLNKITYGFQNIWVFKIIKARGGLHAGCVLNYFSEVHTSACSAASVSADTGDSTVVFINKSTDMISGYSSFLISLM